MKKIILFLLINSMFLIAHPIDYKITSWNASDNKRVNEYYWQNIIRQFMLGENGADIVFIQNISSIPWYASYIGTYQPPQSPSSTPIEEYSWEIVPNTFVYIYFARTKAESKPINSVIISKKRANEIFVINPKQESLKPMLAIRLDKDVFINLSNDKNSTKAIERVYEYFTKSPQYIWTIAGNINIAPQILHNQIPKHIINNISIISPSIPTRKNGKEFDYMVIGNSAKESFQAPFIRSGLHYQAMRAYSKSEFLPIWFSK